MGQPNYAKLAQEIIVNVGGKENIDNVIHCITRLRFYLKNVTKVDTDKIQALDGVAGALYNEQLGQYQVVIGPAVADVYDELMNQLGMVEVEQSSDVKRPKKVVDWVKYGFQVLIGTITGSMIPIIGLLAASGILKGFITLFTYNLKWVDVDSTSFVIVNAIGDSAFYFLPILVGYTAAKQLKSDPIIVATIAGVLVYPNIITIAKTSVAGAPVIAGVPINATFLGLSIHIPMYAYSIFPIIFAAWLARPVGNWFKEKLPVSLRSIFQPLFTVFIVTTVVLVLVGPVISLLSAALASGINWLVTLNQAFAGLIIGGFYQVLVIFGLHWMVIPVIANEISTTGHSVLNAFINFTMIAQGAGALAVWAKAKQTNLKSIAMGGALSSFIGVTEPAVYGINLKYGRVFWMANIGSAVGGLVAGLLKIDMFGFTGSWIGFPSFFSKENPSNIWFFVLAGVMTMVVSFIAVYLWGFNEKDVQQAKDTQKKNVFKEAVN